MTLRQVITALFLLTLLAPLASAQTPPPSVDQILGYPSLVNVKAALAHSYQRPWGTAVTGLEIVHQILADYNPERALINTETRLREIFDRVQLSADERAHLANVAHMLWVEQRRVAPPTGGVILDPEGRPDGGIVTGPVLTPSFGGPRVDLSWTLRDLTITQVDSHLLGGTYRVASPPAHNHHFHFKYYWRAKSILSRMSPFHPAVGRDHRQAIARFVEYAGDHFMHFYAGWGDDRYTTDQWDGQRDPDLSESFQRRLGGCGLFSYVSVLLARAVNVPAAVEHPQCLATEAADSSHRYAFYPTIDRWVHGDAVAGANSAMGLWGESLFLSPAEIGCDSGINFRQSLAANSRGKSDLRARYGVELHLGFNLQRDAARARSVFCGKSPGACGYLASGYDQGYFQARFGHWQPVVSGNSFTIPVRKYRLLDEVAAWWTLDGAWLRGFWSAGGQWRSQARVRESSLRGVHGRPSTTGVVSPVFGCMRGDCLELSGKGEILVDDRPQLRRNDEELTLAMWVKPASGGVLFERRTTGASSSPVYSLALLADGRLTFSYQPASTAGSQPARQLRSRRRLASGDWHHVAVTYEAGGSVRLFLDGTPDASAQAAGRLPMAEWTPRYRAYPAITRIGGGGFRGLIDDVILYYGAQEPSALEGLYRSYGGGGLSWRLATCPLNKSSCADRELRQVTALPTSLSPTFVMLVKHTQGRQLGAVTATVSDSLGNQVRIDPRDIARPGSHSLIDGSYWLVRFRGPDFLSRGALRVEPGSHTWTVRVEGSWNGGKSAVEERLRIAN